MKRFIHLLVCALVAAAMVLPAGAEPGGALWTREEAGGAYVTVRVPFPEGEGMSWGQTRYLGVRYAGTGEPVALTSDYKAGYLFATVPARDAGRPLEVFQGERFDWTDIQHQNEPMSANTLYIRGVLHGDGEGRLNLEQVLTRAEAFSLLVRLLDLEEGGDPGYRDVAPSDWYYGAVSAARAAGLAAADETFRPNDSVSRAEFNTMVYRAFRSVGWADPERGEAQDYADSAGIPEWALEAYQTLGSLSISTIRELDENGESEPEVERLAQPGQGVTRREAVGLIDSALDRLPVYPTQTAIDRGFDRAMPVIDGSTSTYPYTDALYSALFHNAGRHPGLPASHSKSHASYERLIRGEVDVLFAATKASIELEEQAKAAGVELEYIPIAYDAMVFFTNEENPAQGLTIGQLQDIYVRNAYDNWSQVGGPDARLMPYCRNTDSGSHALREEMILDHGALSLSGDILQGNMSTAMSTALTDVAAALETSPAGYAIGYSVYYYYLTSETMMVDVTDNRLHLLAIDVVAPSDETIADGSYPLSACNYIVLRADTPEDSPARRLAEFMVSPEGQEVVTRAGFGALQQAKG